MLKVLDVHWTYHFGSFALPCCILNCMLERNFVDRSTYNTKQTVDPDECYI